jgi:serine protease Do
LVSTTFQNERERVMEKKLIIRHLSGSKINRTNEFLIADFEELSIGRDEGVKIKYDPEKDDLVSRRHATIYKEDGNSFIIKDDESRNGTFVNKQRIFGKTPLSHGDIIQFGPGGPEFRFDLDPPPRAMPPPTREASTYRYSKQTHEISSSEGISSGYRDTGRPSGYNEKGRFTLFHDSFSAYKQKNLRKQISIAAGLLGLLILVGGISYSLIKFEQKSVNVIEKTREKPRAKIADLGKMVGGIAEETILLMSPKAIAEKFSNAVVMIQLDWKLTHKKTNQQVYHQMFGTGTIPAYLNFNGKIIPWLTTDPEKGTNIPIGGAGRGTGFSVSRHGLILTNRHVAAGAATIWGNPSYMKRSGLARVYPVTEDRSFKDKIVLTVDRSRMITVGGQRFQRLMETASSWVPIRETVFVERIDGRFIVTESKEPFISRDTLNVYFPGDPKPMPGRLFKKSINHDAAAITVDSVGVFPEVILEERDKEPVPGEAIAILGYSAASEDMVGFTRTSNPFDKEPVMIGTYNPTLTSGNMGKRINPKLEFDDSSMHFWASGDIYQLTANVTGPGNSGGPVFNSQGRVTGIFFGGLEEGGARVTFAIPIKYGKELIEGYGIINERNS